MIRRLTLIDEERVPLELWVPLNLLKNIRMKPAEFQSFLDDQFPVFLSQQFVEHSPVSSRNSHAVAI
jgi:hypothetical protein